MRSATIYFFRFITVLIFSGLASCKKDNPQPIGGTLVAEKFTYAGATVFGTKSDVDVKPTFTIYFSEPVDEQSAQSLITFESYSSQIESNFTFSSNDSVVSIQPKAPLKYLTKYYVRVKAGLKPRSGNPLVNAQNVTIYTTLDPTDKFERVSDDALLDTIQKKTLRYFYDLADPSSGMARERNGSGTTVTTGGSGFGIMAMIAGVERGFISRANGIARFNKIIGFLETADRFHGAWPHWMDGSTGKVIPFSEDDNGADLVETSYMAQGLITLRQYLTPADTAGNNMINRINNLYRTIEWSWFRQEDQKNVLYWHWSPDKQWVMNFPLSGYFEEQITYFMAATSPTYGIPKIVYTHGFGQDGAIKTNQTYTYNNTPILLPLGSPSPLFWVQYSYLGLNPHFSDDFADYWQQNTNATLIDYNYCIQNPRHYAGYGENCWGLTASDNESGYGAQSPNNDNGTITPTAALSSFPYTPDESMKALKFFYYTLGDKLVGKYGFYDAFDLSTGWFANSTLAIDQGPIVIMIENYRSQLLWNLFESAPEVQSARTLLGFH